MSTIILAGGESTRIKRDKYSLILNGENLLERTIRRLEQLGNEMILVLAQGQANPSANIAGRIKMTNDRYSGKGPLAGMHSGMKISEDVYNLVVACDMPFLNIDLIQYMMKQTSGFEAVVPRAQNKIHPLHAIYSHKCVDVIERMLINGDLRVTHLLNQIKVRYVDESEIVPFDPGYLSFFNLNTPEDLARANEIMRQRGENDDFS